jgi:hypothetical protein
MHVIKYFDARMLFDETLRKTTAQDHLETLCDNYARRLEQLKEALPDRKHYLDGIVSHEIKRLESVKSEYLSDPRKFARICLDRSWTDCRDYKEATADFRRVLGVKVRDNPGIRPELDPDFGKGATVIGKPFLCPINDFVSSLKRAKGLKATSARVRVGMSGFPKNSFYYHSYDGDFTSYSPFAKCSFNRMYVVTDHWDQVVATQFTSESPKNAGYIADRGIGVFNYVQFRRLGKPSAWARYHSKSQENGFELHTLMGDGEGLKEINILILPAPTKRLISHALSIR